MGWGMETWFGGRLRGRGEYEMAGENGGMKT